MGGPTKWQPWQVHNSPRLHESKRTLHDPVEHQLLTRCIMTTIATVFFARLLCQLLLSV